ncbi:MAG: hypothetical protein HPY60_11305 [Candidatus Methanofastidiosum sp.]|nr:hypothetical protein [Methanofastidiosum sp.]
MSQDYKVISVKLKNEKIHRKYKLLHGMGRIVVEELLNVLFEKVSPVEIQNMYILKGEEGVRELIKEKLVKTKEETQKKVEVADIEEVHNHSMEVQTTKVTKKALKIRSDLQGFWS